MLEAAGGAPFSAAGAANGTRGRAFQRLTVGRGNDDRDGLMDKPAGVAKGAGMEEFTRVQLERAGAAGLTDFWPYLYALCAL